MTPGKPLLLLLASLGLAAACSQRPADAPPATASEALSGWAQPPRIQTVTRAQGAVTVTGLAAPGARIVLRGADGAAFAASTDEAGRFDIRIGAPDHDLLLIPETQTGQDAAPAPERLLIVGGAQGPVVMLAPGSAGRRLDGAGALGAVDSDGRMLALSGRAQPGQSVSVTLNGRAVAVAQADATGHWSAVAAPAGGPARLEVGGSVYDYPGEDGAGAIAARAGAGWRLAWDVPSGGRQVTWLPDATG